MGSEEPLRLPDHYNQPSAATVLRGDYTISSDAAGHCVFAESSDLYKLAWTVTAGTTGTGTPTAIAQRTSFLAAARLARVTGIRIQVIYIGAEQTSAGYLSINSKFSLSDVDSRTMDEVHTGSVVAGKAADGALAHVTHQQEAEFQDPSVGGFMNNIYPITVFSASGLPLSTPVFRVKTWRFVEFYPKEGDLFEGEMASEPHDPGALAVHGTLSSSATSFFGSHNLGGQAMQLVKNAATAAYHMAQPMAGAYVRDKARSYLSGLAVNAGMALLAA